MQSPVVSPPPWHFRLAKALIRRGWRGPGLWIRAAHALGLLNRRARYEISDEVVIDVPLDRPECWWDEIELRQYEADVVDAVAAVLGGMPRPWRLIDCGADIGLFSALLTARLGGLDEVVALEPNEQAYRHLRHNVRLLPGVATAWMAAVSDFRGGGRLEAPRSDPSEHAWYLVPDERGSIPVVKLDDFGFSPQGTLILKLDIEGGELAALRGAHDTLAAAEHWIVVFEAHRDVAARTGIDPIECLRFLRTIGPCGAFVAERPTVQLSDEVGLFDQVGDLRIANIVCVNRPRQMLG